MDTIILPGFSINNRAWAEEIQNELNPIFPTKFISWSHWSTGKAEVNWIEEEYNKIISENQGRRINIIAKSIGTIVAMLILKSNPELINKIILCGIPVLDLNQGDEKYYQVLAEFPTDKILCIQNKDDNHGSYASAENLIHFINNDIKIISKPRSDHEYPYSQDFIDFLSE